MKTTRRRSHTAIILMLVRNQEPDTSTTPLPMRYASMGYTSMVLTSMDIHLQGTYIFKYLLYCCKKYMKMQVYIKEKSKCG